MRKRNTVLAVILAVAGSILLSNCTNATEPPLEAPNVCRIEVLLEDHTNDPYAANGTSITAFACYFITLGNPLSFNNISSIRITDRENFWWELSKEKLVWNDDTGVFYTRLCYNNDRPDRVVLGSSSLKITLSDGSSSSTAFTVYGRGDTGQAAGYVYSEAAIGTPKILANPANCSATRSGNSLTINFTCNDSLITDAYIWFYDAADNYIGNSSRLNKNWNLNPTGANSYIIDVGSVPAFTKVRVACEADNTAGKGGVVYRSQSEFILPVN